MLEALTKFLNSNLIPGGEGFAENSNLSTHCIDGDAILLESQNSESHCSENLGTVDIGGKFKLCTGYDARLPGSSGDAGGPVENFQSPHSGNAKIIGDTSNLNPNGEDVAENSNSSTIRIEVNAILLESQGDAGSSDENSEGDDAKLPGSSGDAGGPVDFFQSPHSGNAGVIGETSNLNPDGEDVAENFNSSTLCIECDAMLLESQGDARGSDENSESHSNSSSDEEISLKFSSNVGGSDEISQFEENARILLGSEGNARGTDVNFESLDDVLRGISEEFVGKIGGVANDSNLHSDSNASLTGSLASHTNSVSLQSGGSSGDNRVSEEKAEGTAGFSKLQVKNRFWD